MFSKGFAHIGIIIAVVLALLGVGYVVMTRAPEETPSVLSQHPSAGGPAISHIAPTSGSVGTTVTITGSNFTPTGNRVEFRSGNNLIFTSIVGAEMDGTKILFNVGYRKLVSCLVFPSPVCLPPVPDMFIPGGIYEVVVTNADGVSNSVNFEVITPPMSSPAADTANWKTYRNEEYGIELRYPNVLTPVELEFIPDRYVINPKLEVQFRRYLSEGYVHDVLILVSDQTIPLGLLGGQNINIGGQPAFMSQIKFEDLLKSGSSSEKVTLIRVPQGADNLLIVIWHRVDFEKLLPTVKFF